MTGETIYRTEILITVPHDMPDAEYTVALAAIERKMETLIAEMWDALGQIDRDASMLVDGKAMETEDV